MNKEQECDYCCKKKKLKYDVDCGECYGETCSKSCAKKLVLVNINNLIRKKE